MSRKGYLCLTLILSAALAGCVGSNKQSNAQEPTDAAAAAADTVAADTVPRLLHNGTSDTILQVVTQIFAAQLKGDSIVKNGKPDYYREFDAFPEEGTCSYDTMGRLTTTRGQANGEQYEYRYQYDGKELASEQYLVNGELFYNRTYIYEKGQRVNTIEELYIAGSKTINEYPVDLHKVVNHDGKRIEFGATSNDYTITDARGKVIKESSYSEMDDYCSVIEYSYNDRGWTISINCEGEYLYTYDYTKTDTRGNWTQAIINCNGTPYGIVERNISYY